MNMKHYDNLKAVPRDALREIQFGKLKGKSDISPQWRYEVMTREFGVCGIGWKYEIVKTWTQEANDNQLMLFVEVNLYIKDGEQWSSPIPAIGGDFVLEKDKNGLHGNDEAYKMATTDALGVAMKMLGVAADVYRGLANDSKYGREKAAPAQQQKPAAQPSKPAQQSAPQPQGNIKWPAFWANMKTFGLSEEEVHKIVSDLLQKKITSLTDVITTQQELNKITMTLAKHKKTA